MLQNFNTFYPGLGAFWVLLLCSFIGLCDCFGEMCCLSPQGTSDSWEVEELYRVRGGRLKEWASQSNG